MLEIPKKFDLDNYELSDFFCRVAISIDFHLTGTASSEDYELINRSAEILRDQSRKYRKESKETDMIRKSVEEIDDNLLFFWKTYGEQETVTPEARKNVANRLIDLSENLKCIKDLSNEKIVELEKICLNLSKTT